MGKQRINELNFLRTVAFFAVVMQHLLGIYLGKDVHIWESAGISLLFFASKFSVPAFVFISGLVLFYNYYDRLRYGTFIIKRIKEILLPYILWTAFYFLYFNPYGVRSLPNFMNAILLGKGAYHLWYVVMIFQFYLFLPLYIACFKWIHRTVRSVTGRIIVFAVFLILYALYILLPSYLTPMGLFKPENPVIKFLFVDYITRNSISYIFYFVIGALVGLNLEVFKAILKRYTIILSTTFVIAFVLLEWLYYKNGFTNGKINVMYPSFFKPHYFFFTVLCILFLYRLSICRGLNRGFISRIFLFIGNHSYQAYLVHAFTLNTFTFMIYKTGIAFRPVNYSLVFIASIGSSLCIAFLFDFIWDQTKMRYSRLKLGLNGRMKMKNGDYRLKGKVE